MALILKKLYQGYFWLFTEIRDERSDDFLLIGPALLPLTIGILYLQFVLKWGPEFMKNRPPFNLERILIIFNFVQVIVNTYVVIAATPYMASINWRCEPIDYSRKPMPLLILRLSYYYYLMKLSDLVDTVFFILRKKENQITFLHVYHHFGMVMLGWCGVKFIGGGHSAFLGYVNSFVHAVMYSYYLLTAWDSQYKKSVWWKKHITQLQLVQFLFMLIIYGQLLFRPECTYPRIATYLFVPQNIFMFILFGDFYRKTYMQGAKVIGDVKTLKDEKETDESTIQKTNGTHIKNT